MIEKRQHIYIIQRVASGASQYPSSLYICLALCVSAGYSFEVKFTGKNIHLFNDSLWAFQQQQQYNYKYYNLYGSLWILDVLTYPEPLRPREIYPAILSTAGRYIKVTRTKHLYRTVTSAHNPKYIDKYWLYQPEKNACMIYIIETMQSYGLHIFQ